MFLRDTPGFAWYFMTYELIKRKVGVSDYLPESEKQQSEVLRSLGLFLSGGIAGTVTWIMCYPADFLKTRL